MKFYKGILVGKGSALANAIEQDESLKRQGKAKEAINAKKVYEDTSKRFEALYGPSDAKWFYEKAKEYSWGRT